ncbi:type I polyketide synthase [Chelatococcus reniformis]|uniref:Type I polyketide synthase n=1 Tax=Chelatococcus reniformis TaxID=1494448 RepID=A0A916UM82_9HYPH|nr:type I polyketide synthase [Chelatococcus reniformis]GGC78313.1 type I polyketide synthase [Chelatococcus reniformis]
MNVSLTPLQRAFLALQEAEARLDALRADMAAPIAVIGLGCRAPGGAADADSFWTLLAEGRDAVRPPPSGRWDHGALYDPDPDAPGRIAARAGSFIDDIDLFDADFFGLSPREAAAMDPQQRLLLEVCWEALENAGQAPDRLHGSATGVFMGAAGSDYAYMQMRAGAAALGPHFASGIAHSVLSGRVSYLLGLSGPSVSIDTACSSSLVAVHLACQALRNRECRLALAGGVNLILSPDIYTALSRARMLAPDGRCKAFDAGADGFGRGEGCAVVALKRLSDADSDGDRVLAVIRGSAVNQDGPSSSLTAPNGPAQQAVIRAALAQAGLTPDQIGYVEAHGTGTQLGDPLEAQALGAVFGSGRDAHQPLLIGSAKANVGHLEAAAGAIGLVKCVLALQHATIPAQPHFTTPSAHIAWDDWKLSVPRQTMPWPPIGGRRIAGVSAFGFSGTNAHLVVEAPPPAAAPEAAERSGWLIPLSAHRTDALRALAAATCDAIEPDARLADIARTLTLGRSNRAARAVIRTASAASLRSGLAALSRDEATGEWRMAELLSQEPPRVAFVFTGQGSQYTGMAAGLYRAAPAFRTAFDRCDQILTPLLGQSLRTSVLAQDDAGALQQTGLAQPALFTVEYALAEFLLGLGIKPVAVLGHSVGEFVAACVAGALDLQDALRLIAVRGSLMQSLPTGGAMAAIFAPEARVADALVSFEAEVAIAAVNGPAQTVISGVAAHVEAVCARFAAEDVRTQPLGVSHAFHSPLVTPILDAFEVEAAKASFSAPRVPIISNVTGQRLSSSELATSNYWRRHLRDRVRFADGLTSLAAMDVDICIEVGPHPALSAFGAAVFPDGQGPRFVPTLRRGADDWCSMLDAVGSLYLAGAEIDWRGLDPERAGRPIALPTARFRRQRHWFAEATGTVPPAAGAASGHPLLGVRLRSPLPDVVQFEAVLTPDAAPFLADHVVQQRVIMPAAAMIDMVLQAGKLIGGSPVAAEGMLITEPLVLSSDVPRIVQTVVRRDGESPASFEILSCDAADPAAGWLRHAQGDYGPIAEVGRRPLPPAALGEEIAGAQHYEELARRGLTFGPSLRGVRCARPGAGNAMGDITTPDAAGDGAFAIHPAQLDACLQVIAAALPAGTSTYLPVGIDRITVVRRPGRDVQAHVELEQHQPSLLRADVVICDGGGVVGRLEGVSLRPPRGAMSSDLYAVDWRPADIINAWMPAPGELARALDGRIVELEREHDLATYQHAFLALEEESVRSIVRALIALGWQPALGERVDVQSLAQRLAVVPRYHRALGRFLDILAEDGVLRRAGDAFVVNALPEASSIPDELALSDGTDARRAMAMACGRDLPGILAGRIDPLHVLFPGGASALAERLYRDSPESKAYNGLLAETIAGMVARAPAHRKVRILEVGGGSGGSTGWILQRLPPGRVDYCFTDVGTSLVERARDTFASFDFVSFRTLDLEADAGAQGLEPESFDIVIAANVVHATADLRRTLGRLRSLLGPGGMLCLLEMTGFERWIDITFGLTDGWWLGTDLDLRPAYPLLDRRRWIDVLASSGFTAAEIGPALATSREALFVARRVDAPPQRVAIVGEGNGLAAALAARITAAGGEAQVVDAAAGLDVSVDALIHLGFLDLPALEPGDGGAALRHQRDAFAPLLAAVQAAAARGGRSPRLWLLATGAVAVGAHELADPGQATVLGFRRAAALEHPEWQPTLIDLDPSLPPPAQADIVMAHLATSAAEAEIAVRGGHVFVSRLGHLAAPRDAPRLRLEAAATGTIGDLDLVPFERCPPGPGSVEIRVAASGLNFRDVMNAVGMRADGEPLGGECAGVVTAVGPGVDGVQVGDSVVATAAGAFASHVLADARCVVPRPRGLTHAQAAALPLVAMTARHALEELAGLRAGQSVLIHAGAGGVGLAAIQIAQRAGATIFATAGSDAKRALLRGLGVAHVLSSRTLEFEAEIGRLTNGGGVDVVLNSLSGPFIGASVRSLAPAGIFIEIGKRDIWSPGAFRDERPRGRYHVVDLSITRLDDPARWGAMLRSLMDDVARGAFKPLPVRTFPLTQAADAFACMAQARHIGKLVLTAGDGDSRDLADLDPGGVYLVTGGFAGLGLETARRLVVRGARWLALLGRSSPGPEAQTLIGGWRAAGVDVLVLRADVGDDAELADAFDTIDRTGRPLRGVVHAAGALADGALSQQQWERFSMPLKAKVAGAWALHRLTRDRQLDFFVLYSSLAATLGSAGQVNHAAANAFMDALAQFRRGRGLPGLSIGWGAWSDIGAAAARGVDQSVAKRGIGSIAPEQGMDLLESLVGQAPAHVVVSPIQWPRYLAPFDGAVPSLLSDFRRDDADRPHASRDGAGREATPDPVLRELEAAAPAARRGMLVDFVGRTVARVLGRQGEGDLDPRRPLNEMGLDSLLAVELRNHLGASLGLSRVLPATLVFTCPTIEALADHLEERLVSPSPETAAPVSTAPADPLTAIDGMSDAEIEALFARMVRT